MKLFADTREEDILRNIDVILETPKYSCPLNRDLGLSIKIIDEPTEKAKALIRAEIAAEIEKYEPRARIKSISFESDPIEGIIKPKITLEFV